MKLFCNRFCKSLVFPLTFFLLVFSGTASAAAGNDFNAAGLFHKQGKPPVAFRSLLAFEDTLRKAQPAPVEGEYLSSPGDTVLSTGAYLDNVFADLKGGTERIFSRENLPLAMMGTGLAALALAADHEVQSYFQDHHPLRNVSEYSDRLGRVYTHLGIGTALFGAGQLTNDEKLADAGIVSLEALLVNGVATLGLKYAVRRARPDRSARTSFPSAHASSTAALAASISGVYDWDLKVAVPLYAATAFIGASRIDDNKHYLSDVLAGITLGTVVGASFAGYHKEKKTGQKRQRKISFKPIFDGDLKGGVFTMKW